MNDGDRAFLSIPTAYRKIFSWLLVLVMTACGFLTACSLPQVSAEERLFSSLSLEFLGEYQLPQSTFQDTVVGGLSGITYDRQANRFYAVSDDQRQPRLYTLQLQLSPTTTNTVNIETIEVTDVTLLKDQEGQPYASGELDLEGITLSPQRTVFVSSEGNARQQIPPAIKEFDLQTGQDRRSLPIPERFIPQLEGEQPLQGIQPNFGFEALTLSPTGTVPVQGEPLRLFTATESALAQDLDLEATNTTINNRFLHYLLGDGPPVLISEHLYPLNPDPKWSLLNGLTELVALDAGGRFLSLERAFGFVGYRVQIFQVAVGGATDTKEITSLKSKPNGVYPIRKQLLLDLNQLEIPIKNLEGMTLGPRLPDGSQSLLLVSDNNLHAEDPTQFLLFRLKR